MVKLAPNYLLPIQGGSISRGTREIRRVPIYIAVLLVPLGLEESEVLSVLLFVSRYASHLYRNKPPICTAILWEKSKV